MKLVIVRHADPDYSIDSLTPTGWKEAELLSNRLVRTPADAYYVSPLGRANDTASLTLKKLGRTAETCEWLREFSPRIVKPGMDRSTSIWDWLPEIWTKEPRYYDPEEWYHTDAMRSVNAEQEYNGSQRNSTGFWPPTDMSGKACTTGLSGQTGTPSCCSAISVWSACS